MLWTNDQPDANHSIQRSKLIPLAGNQPAKQDLILSLFGPPWCLGPASPAASAQLIPLLCGPYGLQRRILHKAMASRNLTEPVEVKACSNTVYFLLVSSTTMLTPSTAAKKKSAQLKAMSTRLYCASCATVWEMTGT